MKLKKLFTEHPASVKETYWQHLAVATIYSFKMIFAGLACFIHAIFPFLFVHTASNLVMMMAKHIEERQQRGSKHT